MGSRVARAGIAASDGSPDGVALIWLYGHPKTVAVQH